MSDEPRPHALLVPVGSAGDVHPFIGLGTALRRRGLAVTMIANGHFEALIRDVGLEFVRFGTAEEFDTLTTNPDVWDARKGFEIISRAMVERTPELYRLVRAHARPDNTVVVAGALAFGARIAQEAHDLRLATVQLQPVCFRSEFDPPVLHPWLSRIHTLPRVVTRGLFRLVNRAVDRVVGPGLNRFRASLGLPRASGFYDVWWNSPHAVIACFPEWFAPPQPDWPPQVVCTGFPLYDAGEIRKVPAAVESFLASGEPPVVFTPGSAMRHGRRFFEESVEACTRLGARGLLLTTFTDQVPAPLPAHVMHAEYVPLGQLLPRCRALASHGGIGTMAQGLAAGVPQLVMPMAYDQPDNAVRARRLGVGRWLSRRAYRAPAVARAIEDLTTSPDVAGACRRYADLVRGDHPLDAACAVVERLARAPRRGPERG